MYISEHYIELVYDKIEEGEEIIEVLENKKMQKLQ